MLAEAKDAKEEVDAAWKEPPYAQVPLWLISNRGLTHSQARLMVLLTALLGGRRRPHHLTYREIADLVTTDLGTISKGMTMFIRHGWLVTSGPRNYRKYRLDRTKVHTDLWHKVVLEEDD
jgi:hypothetical protein